MKKIDWKVRRASVEDVDRPSLIGSATFLETFAGILDGSAIVSHCQREHSASAYQGYLEAGASAWLADAEPDGAPVGFALLGSTDLPGRADNGSDLELKRIYVLSRLHGQGLGAELMQRAIELAAERGASRLLLGVYANNARAIAFYHRNGFSRIADRRFRVGDRDYDDVVLAKPMQDRKAF